MIIVMKQDAEQQQVDGIIHELEEGYGVQVQINSGVDCTVLGVIGDTASIDRESFSVRPGVERVVRVQESYKKANRKFHPEDTVVSVRGVPIGGKQLALIAGPCSVENLEQMTVVAEAVQKSGAQILRGGAYKPRTSPYAFQGLEKTGIEILQEVRNRTGMPIVTELTTPRHVEMFEMVVDMIQIGARNMQNFELLKEVGRTNKPVLLKRGLSSTIEELLMSAEYIMSQGNDHVVLCERGIRTFETYTRNTLDLSAVVALKKLSHLPVLVDPSHASGRSDMAHALSLAAIAAGADGLIIEVHNDPANALCDGPQSLTPEQYQTLVDQLRPLAQVMGRTL